MMKLLLPLILLLLPILTGAQITFESIAPPRDFSIGDIMRSPAGEYFIQALNDRTTLYTSMDGVQWTEVLLPVEHTLYDMQFFSDGTPLIKPITEAHMIRRNDTLYTMKAGGGDFVKASFIKDDTLFVYDNHRFAYSLDTGQHFTTVFTYHIGQLGHTADLWKFDQHFVLHHTAGALDMLSVFNQAGERVLHDTLDLDFSASITYNSCGQVLFHDLNNYYLINEEGLEYETGISSFNIPVGLNFQSAGGHFYVRAHDLIYKSDGCDLVWNVVASGDSIESSGKIWLDDNGDIYLLNWGDAFYTVLSNGAYENYFPEISHASVLNIGESGKGHQFARTRNKVFTKTVHEEQWEALDSNIFQYGQFKYAPNGDLYIPTPYNFLYSRDNGHSFTTILFPPFVLPLGVPSLHVLDDSILFAYSGITHESFYSVNNGLDWIDPGVGIINYDPTVKLVGNDILVADGYNLLKFFRVNVISGELTKKTFSNPEPPGSSAITILDDGTFYVQAFNFSGDSGEYYRFRFGEELTFLGSFPQLASIPLASSGNLLYVFGQDEYFLYDGQDFIAHEYINLNQPDLGYTHFIVAENEYLYAIVNQTELYRSTEPLSILIGTNEPVEYINFNVFPNPVGEELTIDLNEIDHQRIDSYEIIDQLGQVVRKSDFMNDRAINVSKLIPGIYNLILMENGTSVGMKKFLKVE